MLTSMIVGIPVAKPVPLLRNTRRAARAPGSLGRRVAPLLTGGNRTGQQPQPELTRVVQGCFRTGSGRSPAPKDRRSIAMGWSWDRQARTQGNNGAISGGTRILPEPNRSAGGYHDLGSTMEIPECPARTRTRVKVSRTRTRVKVSRTRTRVRSPASSRVAARSPASNGKSRIVRAKNPVSQTPVSRARADASFPKFKPSESDAKVPPMRRDFSLGGCRSVSAAAIKVNKGFKLKRSL
jgi:hypothetical protein